MRIAISVLLLAAVLVGCGGDTSTTPGSSTPAPQPPGANADGILQVTPGVADGPGISIGEAIAQAGLGPFLVNGALFVAEDGGVLLCEAIAESFPPQCGGTRLEVRGLDLSTVAGLEEANGVRWAEAVQVLGTVALVEG
jgi:hypothetical protein